jgi:hypothetical protein
MKKSIIITFLGFLLNIIMFGQNLVPNSSFESTSCTVIPGDLTHFGAENWYNPNNATPDYYGTSSIQGCVTSIYNNALINSGEWQFPRTGERMVGLFAAILNSCSREYLQAKLIEPLEAGEIYCAELFVSLSNRSQLCTDCFGVVFTQDSLLNHSTHCELGIIPDVSNPIGNLLNDTTLWTLISGQFIAQGGEQFITIGNLLSDEYCMLVETPGTKPELNIAYYFVDDVSVEKCTLTTVIEMKYEKLELFPNPTKGVVSLTHSKKGQVKIFDLQGNLITEMLKRFESLEIETHNHAKGMYIVIFTTEDGEVEVNRLIIREK